MKNKHNGGFSLIEVMLAMVILAAIVVPTCTSLVLSYRMNAKTEELMKAQLAVSSAVETLMANGVTDDFVSELRDKDETNPTGIMLSDDYPDVAFKLEDKGDYYAIEVMDVNEMVSVETSVRDLTSEEGGGNK